MLTILPWGKILTAEFMLIIAPIWIGLISVWATGLRSKGKAQEQRDEPVQAKAAPETETKTSIRVEKWTTTSAEPKIKIRTRTVRFKEMPTVIIPPWKPEEYEAGLIPRVRKVKEEGMAVAREPPSTKEIRVGKMEKPSLSWRLGQPDRKGLWEIGQKLGRGIKQVINEVRKGATNEEELRKALRSVIREQHITKKLDYHLAMLGVICRDDPEMQVFGEEEEEGDLIF